MAERWDKGRSVNHIEGIENIVVESVREREATSYVIRRGKGYDSIKYRHRGYFVELKLPWRKCTFVTAR